MSITHHGSGLVFTFGWDGVFTIVSYGEGQDVPEFEELFNSDEEESDVSSEEVARMLDSLESDSSHDIFDDESYD